MSTQAKIQLLYPAMMKLRNLRRNFDFLLFIYNFFIQGTMSATKIEKIQIRIEKMHILGELQDPFNNLTK